MQNSLKPVSAGNIPDEVNVIIEIPAQSSPVKYEIDKATGARIRGNNQHICRVAIIS
jgi:inorganic pyrophosphatase